jgi:diaminopimelate epimerase
VCRTLPAAARLAGLGKKLEGQPLFPKRVNVEFVQVLDAENCRVYFYERGVGPTQASSTGSAAVFAVLRRLGLAGDRLLIEHEPEPIRLHWQDGIHIRIVTRLVGRGEYFL